MPSAYVIMYQPCEKKDSVTTTEENVNKFNK